MYVIVGLGNPGMEYKNTRHNMGFMVADALSKNYSIPFNKIEAKGIVGRGNIEKVEVMLVKPHTFMNLSGETVKSILSYYKIDIENLLIIYDDIHLPLGELKIRQKGSHGGQNGMRDIIQRLQTQDIQRIRLGIGPQPLKMDAADFVLGSFSKQEAEQKEMAILKAVKAVGIIVTQGMDQAMNDFNGLG